MLKILIMMLLGLFYCQWVLAESPIEGNWVTIDDQTGKKRAVIHFDVSQGLISGTVVDVFPQPGDSGICSACPGEFKDKPTKGLRVVWGLKEVSPGTWEGGKILDAKTGKIYRVKMAVKGDKLLVRGYIGVSLLGRTQIWERV